MDLEQPCLSFPFRNWMRKKRRRASEGRGGASSGGRLCFGRRAKLSHAPLPLSGRTDRQREKESTRSREGAHIDRRIMGQVSKPYSHPLGLNSIDIKNLGPVFRLKLRPISVLYFQFYISGEFSGRFSGPYLCQLN